MANIDYAGLLTGISGQNQRPSPFTSPSRDQQLLGFAAKQNEALTGRLGGMFGQQQQDPVELAKTKLVGLDPTNPADQPQFIQLLNIIDPAKAAQFKQQLDAKAKNVQKNKAVSEIVSKEFGNARPDLTTAVAEGHIDLPTALALKKDSKAVEPWYITSQEKGSVASITPLNGKFYSSTGKVVDPSKLEESGFVITPKYYEAPASGGVTNINTGEELKVVQFKLDAQRATEVKTKASDAYAQYIPVIENMQAAAGQAEFGAGTPFLAAANNTLVSLANQLGFELEGDISKDSTLFFNANSKLLKQRLLEATKGAISNLENTEITKNTANTSQPKQVAIALLNTQQASLESSMDRSSAMDAYLRDNKSLGGFDEVWGQYIKQFPRTSGYHVTGEGDNKKIVDNFELVEGNFKLFEDLYAHKTTASQRKEPVTFVTKGGVTDTLDNQRKSFVNSAINKIMDNAGLSGEPSEAIKLSAERLARKRFGAYLKQQLELGSLEVVK